MNGKSILLAAWMVFGSGLAAHGEAVDKGSAKKAVQANLASPEGKKFADSASKVFAANHPRTAAMCRDSVNKQDTASFALYIKLSRRGKVKEAAVDPATQAGECLLAKIKADSFPPPPGPNYWIRLETKAR